MAKEDKIKFKLSGLIIKKENIDEKFISEVLEKKFKEGIKASLKISIDIKPSIDKLLITNEVLFEFKDSVFLDFAIENEFHIENLIKHVIKEGEKFSFKNVDFVHYLVEHSLSHSRAIQVLKFSPLIEDMQLIPFFKISKWLNKKRNELAS